MENDYLDIMKMEMIIDSEVMVAGVWKMIVLFLTLRYGQWL